MFTVDEMNAMIEKEGELAVVERMAMHQVDATVDLLNKFLETNAGYRHPAVAMSYAVEMLMMLLTETVPPKDWEKVGAAAIENIDDAIATAIGNNPPENSDLEPDQLAAEKEPTHGES